MNYCSDCGQKVEHLIPPGDHLLRFVCSACGTVHYQNPKLVVGAIVEHGDRLLLCRRAIEPRRNFWTLPAGFMENDETTAQGAARETFEEALAHVEMGPLFTLINVPYVNQVHLFFRATLARPEFGPTPESLEVALFAEPDIPWQEIAFPTVGYTLRRYFEDRRKGQFGFYTHDIPARPPR